MDTDLLKDVLAIILPLLVTWMFPQVLLNGVNPLIALNQSVNPEVFIVFHLLLPPMIFLVTGTDLNSLKW